MKALLYFPARVVTQFQSATLGFLIGSTVIAAFGTRLQIPYAIYQVIVFMLLMAIGCKGGMEVRQVDLVDMIIPALSAVAIGVVAVLLGAVTLARLPSVKADHALATAGHFGAVNASTRAPTWCCSTSRASRKRPGCQRSIPS